MKLTSPGADLTVYGGDFNTEPGDVPYSILRSLAGLEDSWLSSHGQETGGHTCGTVTNSFTTEAERRESPRGKRIDYILYSAGRGRSCYPTSCSLPLPSTIPASLAALASSSCSYSDHEAVTAVLQLQEGATVGAGGDNGHTPPCSETTIALAQDLLSAALLTVASDQKRYSLLAVVAAILWVATFSSLLLPDCLLFSLLLFATRLLLALCCLYWLVMASLWSRREQHALQGGQATLRLLQGRGYGAC